MYGNVQCYLTSRDSIPHVHGVLTDEVLQQLPGTLYTALLPGYALPGEALPGQDLHPARCAGLLHPRRTREPGCRFMQHCATISIILGSGTTN